MRSALPAVIIACAATLLLGGCVPQEPVVVPPVEQQSEPVFASDEEALAAATDAYKAYLEMSDLIAQEGGKDPERIAPFVTEDGTEDHVSQFSPYSEASLHIEGTTRFDTVALQQYTEVLPGEAEVGIYVCLDVTSVRVINTAGKDVTPSDRRNRLPLEIGFESADSSNRLLVVARSESWHGSDFC